jgi:hypothetical protein
MTPDQVRGRLWAQRFKRVFGTDLETCPHCGRAVRIIACIENPVVIDKILTHLAAKTAAPEATRQCHRKMTDVCCGLAGWPGSILHADPPVQQLRVLLNASGRYPGGVEVR